MFVKAGRSFEATLAGAPTGLTGTLGIQILDNTGNVTTPRQSAGIAENPVGSGFYAVTLTAPPSAGQYSLFWDTGAVGPSTTASEELVVSRPIADGLSFADLRSELDDLIGLDLTPTERDRLLNEGNMELTTQSEWLRVTENIGPTQNGVFSYPLPANFWTVKKVTVSGVPYASATEETVDQIVGGRLRATGALYYLTFDDMGGEQLSLYPVPTAPTPLVLRYVARPPTLVSDEDVPVVPKIRGIIDYAASIGFGSDEDNAELRTFYKQQFDIAVAELKRLRRNRSGGGVRSMRLVV